MIRKPHLQLIARHSVKHGIRGGAGLVSLLVTLVLGLALANVVIGPLDAIDRGIAKGLAESSPSGDHELSPDEAQLVSLTAKSTALKGVRKALDWAIDPSPEQLTYLADTRPVVVSAILGLLFLVVPLLSCLGGFNQTSADIGSKGLRFLLIRTERPNIYLGRLIGTFLYGAAVYAGLFLILALYMVGKVPLHPPGAMLAWFAQGYVRLLVFSLPYVALTAAVSAAVDAPFGALVVSLLLAYFVPLLIAMGGNIDHGARVLQYLTPWGFKWWLLQPMGGALLAGVGAMLGFTALFGYVGLRGFSGRDL